MAPHLHETRQPSPSPDVLQLKSAAGLEKSHFGNHPPIRPGHAQSGQFFVSHTPAFVPIPDFDTRWNPGHTGLMEPFCG